MADLVFDKITSIDKQDGGQALIVELHATGTEGDQEGLFVRVQSWSTTADHVALNALLRSGFTVTIKAN
jgi:hypothetical protein